VKFVHTIPNVTIIKPKKSFRDVLQKYGYPVVSKEEAQKINEARRTKSKKLRKLRLGTGRHAIPKKWRYLLDAPFQISERCCYWLKKAPAAKYEKETGRKMFLGEMASEGQARRQKYLRYGCNAYDVKRPRSCPLGIWTEEDVWAYIKQEEVEISPVYSMGYTRTGCIFCGFGVHLEKPPNRFERLYKTHPKLWKYCMEKLGMRKVLDYMDIPVGAKSTTKEPLSR